SRTCLPARARRCGHAHGFGAGPRPRPGTGGTAGLPAPGSRPRAPTPRRRTAVAPAARPRQARPARPSRAERRAVRGFSLSADLERAFADASAEPEPHSWRDSLQEPHRAEVVALHVDGEGLDSVSRGPVREGGDQPCADALPLPPIRDPD